MYTPSSLAEVISGALHAENSENCRNFFWKFGPLTCTQNSNAPSSGHQRKHVSACVYLCLGYILYLKYGYFLYLFC